MLFGGVALAVVGGVALDDGAVDVLNHGAHELRVQVVLVALLAGVDLHRHLAGKRDPQPFVHLHHCIRGDPFCEINLCLAHNGASCEFDK